MITELLGAVQTERQRHGAPAVVALRKRKATRQKIRGSFGLFTASLRRRLGVLRCIWDEAAHFRYLGSAELVIARRGHKFQEVRRDLIKHRAPADQIDFLGAGAGGLRSSKVLVGLMTAANTIAIWAYLLIRMRGRLAPYFLVTCLYATYYREIAQIPRRYWVVIGDLSPQQIAMAAAARRAGHAVISWQWDYLDFKRFPVRPDIAVVLNESGIKLARRTGEAVEANDVFWRPSISQRPVNLERASTHPVGVLLNAFAEESVLHTALEEIQSIFGRPLFIRLHPNSRLHGATLPEGMTVQRSSESLEAFVASTGVVVCGNTSAQLKALCLGAPVVQVPGLDPMLFDQHGYIARGVTFGVQDIGSLDLQSVCNFYSSDQFKKAARALLGPPIERRRPSLDSLVEALFPRCRSKDHELDSRGDLDDQAQASGGVS